VSDFAAGLTMLTDLRAGPDGALYGVQFARFTEQGPELGSGAVIRVKAGDASEVVVSGLMFPTSIDFNVDGDAFVTVNGVGAPGSGQVVRFAGLTEMSGAPLTESASPTPAAEEPTPAPAEEATPAPASEEPTPETMPVTGSESGQFAVFVIILVLVSMLGVILAGRRRLA
jgi:hypothetical protein